VTEPNSTTAHHAQKQQKTEQKTDAWAQKWKQIRIYSVHHNAAVQKTKSNNQYQAPANKTYLRICFTLKSF
jgi:hypothetical protein